MILGHGTTFSWNGAVVAELKAINGIESSIDMVDVTTHQSANFHKEVMPGLIDPGEVSIEGLFSFTDTAGQHAMLSDFNARVSRACIITFPSTSGASWSFTGYVTSIKIGDAPTDDGISFSATIKPTGKPQFAVATSVGLSAVALSNAAVLAPVFANGTLEYVATVLTGVSSLTVTPTAAAGVITVNGSVVSTGVASSAIPLGAAGSITPVTITVTETNKAPKSYVIRVVRA